eukprot:PhF_6_TR6961/c0_g1_i1/m.10265
MTWQSPLRKISSVNPSVSIQTLRSTSVMLQGLKTSAKVSPRRICSSPRAATPSTPSTALPTTPCTLPQSHTVATPPSNPTTTMQSRTNRSWGRFCRCTSLHVLRCWSCWITKVLGVLRIVTVTRLESSLTAIQTTFV